MTKIGNKIDNVVIDVENEFKKFNNYLVLKNTTNKKNYLNGRVNLYFFYKFLYSFKLYFCLIQHYLGIQEKLIYSNLNISWFTPFKKFWVDFLKNRPIDIFEFHFLRLDYRKKFQNLTHPEKYNPKTFIDSWQSPCTLYLLFQSIWKYAQSNYLDFYKAIKYIPMNAKILEYGCGTAPFTEMMIKYGLYKNFTITLSDIKQINFLYAVWKHSSKKNINFIDIDVNNTDNLKDYQKYNVIVCTTVFEHIPNPLDSIKILYNHLEKKVF